MPADPRPVATAPDAEPGGAGARAKLPSRSEGRRGEAAADVPAAGARSDPPLEARVPSDAAGSRLDAVASRLFPGYSRSRLQRWIAEGFLTVDGRALRAKARLGGGETLALALPPDVLGEAFADDWSDGAGGVVAEPLDFPVVHEDDSILVVDKPAGLVMHPAPGHPRGTLMNALLHRDPKLRGVPRAGIVHRLDRETTGLVVVARTLLAHTALVRQLESRTMGREYLAVVLGEPPDEGSVDAPIGRHPRDRKRMAVVSGGRPALSRYRVRERFAGPTALVAVRLESGRTHQIRVHMTQAGFPLLGDPLYGRRRGALPAPLAGDPVVAGFARQALHATRLRLAHPEDGAERTFEAPPPADLAALLAALRGARVGSGGVPGGDGTGDDRDG